MAITALNQISGAIVNESIAIHRDLGPGLFESVYEMALAASLERQGLHVERQRPIGFTYLGIELEQCFRIDLLVEQRMMRDGIKRVINDLPRSASTHPVTPHSPPARS